jgi:hypothetical protein
MMMSSPSILHWISRSNLVIPPVIIVETPLDRTSPSLTKLGLGKGSSFQIYKLGRELGCFHMVVQGHKGIFDKLKLSSDFLKLSSEVLAAVIVVSVSLDLRDDGPVIEVMGSLAEVVGSLAEVVGSLAEVVGGLAEVVGSLAEVVGSLAEVVGSLAEVVGSLTEVVGGLAEGVVGRCGATEEVDEP